MKEDALLAEAADIAAKVYKIADEIEVGLPDEKWRTAGKLKNTAGDAHFFVAQVAGAGKGQSPDYDCISARKTMYALRALYVFAGKQHMVELDPELVVSMDKLIAHIDAERVVSKQELKQKTKEDLAPWLEEYRIWQQISKE